MKKAVKAVMLGAAALAVAFLAPAQPASAAQAAESGIVSAAISQATEFSAQQRKKRRVYRGQPYRGHYYVADPRSPYYRRPGVAPSFGYIGPPGYAGEYAWRRSLGQCVVDLGYGRWEACGSR
jgi:hypothetical protein